MEFFRIRRDIPFMRHALVFNIVSFVTFALAVFFLVSRGLHLSIEFTGGTALEVEYSQTANLEKTRSAVDSLGFGEVQVQNFGTSRDVLVRLPVREQVKQADVAPLVFAALCKAEGGTVATKSYTTPQGEQVSRPSCSLADGSEPIKLSRTEFVGPAVGDELASDGAKALGLLGDPLRVEVLGRRDRRQPA
jgi:preprotein translocase subunit SecF